MRDRSISPLFVRPVRGAVRAPVRAQTRAVIGLCGVCGMTPSRARGRAREQKPHSIHKPRLPRTRGSHPAHPAHLSIHAGFTPHRCPHSTPHTPHSTLFRARDSFITRHPKGKEVEVVEKDLPAAPAITCGPENVQHFNARMREELPEFHTFAKLLRERGMIDGLRGARIAPVGGLEQRGVVPVTSAAAESRQADLEWAKRIGGRK